MTTTSSQATPGDAAGRGLEQMLPVLRAALGADHVLTDADTLELYSVDFSELRLATAAAVVRPGNTAQVQELVRLAGVHGVPLVPRGASMSYTLGAVPLRPGSIVVDMQRMNRILRIDTDNLNILVEPGVTWAQIHAALADSDFAIPFLGTFSGSRATVGGGLGNWAVGWGKGDVAEYLLGVEVVLGDGRLLHTGALATNFDHPGLTCFGPELTRLFVHDAGAFGIKTAACFRLERKPGGTAYASWGFNSDDAALAFMQQVARDGSATDCFVFGSYHHGVFMSQPAPPAAEMRALLRRVIRNSGSVTAAARNLWTLMRTGRLGFLARWSHSVHVAVDGASESAARAAMAPLRRLARQCGAAPLPGGFLIAVRARPFGPIDDLIVGRDGESCFPSNCTVSMGQGMEVKHALDRFFAEQREFMQTHGLTHTQIYLAMRNVFCIEPIIYWKDRMNPLRRSILNPERAARFGDLAEDRGARDAALALRQRMVREVFAPFRPTHVQVGKYYPFRERLEGTPAWDLLQGFKQLVDPQRLLNPGVLGLD